MEFRKIEVVPISGNIGALINGAQLNALNDETFEDGKNQKNRNFGVINRRIRKPIRKKI